MCKSVCLYIYIFIYMYMPIHIPYIPKHIYIYIFLDVCVYQNTKIQTNMSSEEDAFYLEFSIYEIYSEYRPKERIKRQKEVSVGRSSCISLM